MAASAAALGVVALSEPMVAKVVNYYFERIATLLYFGHLLAEALCGEATVAAEPLLVRSIVRLPTTRTAFNQSSTPCRAALRAARLR